ncbi:hypothetical protein SCUCBS95973_004606 [Sporothrix curviconia]|uniref:Tudor domain-containing protein n=1 Tax=Sporothrix curviconia TaxID=1260050 RepID=A0ABP0BQ21_9PEZI
MSAAQLAQLQEDRAQYQEQLDLVLASLHDDPGNDELLGLKAELASALEIIDESLAELKPETSSKSTATSSKKTDSQRQPAVPDVPPSSSSAAAAAAPANDDAAARVVYKVNESILARWVTGDKAFYPARIMSVTGSATAPMYTVKFKSYDTIETLRARDIRPLAPAHSTSNTNSTSNTSTAAKRKADSSAEATESSAAPSGSSTPLSPATATPPPPLPPPPPGPPSSSSSPYSYAQPPAPPPPPPPSSDSTVSAATAVSPPPPPPPPPPPHPSTPASTAIPPPSRFRTIDRFSQGVVSSASPQLYTQAHQLQQQQQRTGGSVNNAGTGASSATPLNAEEPPVKKFKKIKATKQLEAGKSKWQEFSSKGKTGKPGTKKDSMFRTPEGIHGRVGFTGSGQAMRKDVTRSRHIYQTNDDAD